MKDFNNKVALITGAGSGIASAQNAIIPTTVTVDSNQYDGQHFKVYHPNHGHHDIGSVVTFDNITGDSVPTKLKVKNEFNWS